MRFNNYKDFQTKELEICEKTNKKYGKFFQKSEELINILLKLQYYISPPRYKSPKDISSDNYNFYLFTSYLYYEIPKSIESSIILLRRGLYSNSIIICRSILESLVKHKYFFYHKDKFLEFEKNQTLPLDKEKHKKNLISFRTMFNSVAGKDTYKKIYKNQSLFTHKNFAANYYSQNSKEAFLTLPNFNTVSAEYIINHLIYLLYGYINLTEFFFPKIDHSFLKDCEDILLFCKRIIEKDKINFPKKRTWIECMEKIIDPETK